MRFGLHKICALIFVLFLIPVSAALAFSEGTRTWQQSSFDELAKGTAHGVAIRSQGGMELAPAYKALFTTPSAYIWSITADQQGNLYAASGAPARIYRIAPDGQSTPIFEPQELQVQALVVDKNGVIYAATNPDGKVYKIEHRAGAAVQSGKSGDAKNAAAKSDWSATVYFDPATKYIWDLVLDESGNLFVATGDHGDIFRVTSKGEHAVFFTSDEAHIRVLALDAKGNLIAGSDGSGLVYRIAPDGKAFVLYSAPKKEITALALDKAGNIYAAGVGEKHPSAAPAALPITPTPSPAMSHGPGQQSGIVIANVTPVGPIAMGNFPAPGTGATGGSEIYRITPDGSPTRIWSSREDLVYALAFDQSGRLLAGTGNRGHIFAVAGEDDFVDLLKASATQVTAFAPSPAGGLYASTSNLGKVFLLGAAGEAEGSYESDVFDAHIFSRWGRVEYRGQGNVELFARSGNVDNPDRNWSAWEKVDLRKDAKISAPPARFVQWKAVLHSGTPAARLNSVTLNYLPKNVAPDFDDVTVQPGVRYQPLLKAAGSDSGGASGQSPIHFEVPVPTIHDRDSIGVKWDVHDDNDDQMVYAVYYRGDGETRWLLLKDKLTDKSYSFDASLLPDGGYTIKVAASDAPSHSPGEALISEKESDRFEVDTTPPQIEVLKASVEAGQIHVAFQAVDSFSPIKRAEYSLDAGPWQYVEPVDKISDSKTEAYDFRVPGPAGEPEHVLVVRTYDHYDNMSSAKTVIRVK